MMINYMGGIAGGLLAFLLGAIWYAPGVFGHIWARHCGLSEAQIKSASPRKMFLLALPLSLLAGLVFAAFLGDAGLGLSIGAGLAAGVCWVQRLPGDQPTFMNRNPWACSWSMPATTACSSCFTGCRWA